MLIAIETGLVRACLLRRDDLVECDSNGLFCLLDNSYYASNLGMDAMHRH